MSIATVITGGYGGFDIGGSPTLVIESGFGVVIVDQTPAILCCQSNDRPQPISHTVMVLP